MRLGLYLVAIGAALVALVIGLIWLKDRLQSQRLARVAHSEPMMRLAVLGGALAIVGLLLIVADRF